MTTDDLGFIHKEPRMSTHLPAGSGQGARRQRSPSRPGGGDEPELSSSGPATRSIARPGEQRWPASASTITASPRLAGASTRTRPNRDKRQLARTGEQRNHHCCREQEQARGLGHPWRCGPGASGEGVEAALLRSTWRNRLTPSMARRQQGRRRPRRPSPLIVVQFEPKWKMTKVTKAPNSASAAASPRCATPGAVLAGTTALRSSWRTPRSSRRTPRHPRGRPPRRQAPGPLSTSAGPPAGRGRSRTRVHPAGAADQRLRNSGQQGRGWRRIPSGEQPRACSTARATARRCTMPCDGSRTGVGAAAVVAPRRTSSCSGVGAGVCCCRFSLTSQVAVEQRLVSQQAEPAPHREGAGRERLAEQEDIARGGTAGRPRCATASTGRRCVGCRRPRTGVVARHDPLAVWANCLLGQSAVRSAASRRRAGASSAITRNSSPITPGAGS